MRSRRAILVGGSSAVLAAMAGCSALTGSNGDDSDSTPAASPDIGAWLPASLAEGEELVMWMATPSALLEVDDLHVQDGVADSVVGLEMDAVDRYVTAFGYSSDGQEHTVEIAIGEIDPDDVRQHVEAEWDVELERDGTVGDFARYAAVDGTLVVGFDDDISLFGSPPELLEAAVDAGRGGGDSLLDVDADVALALETVGPVDFVLLAAGDDASRDSHRASATGFDFADGESARTDVYVYEDEETAEANEAQRRSTAERDDFLEVEVVVEGRQVIVFGPVRTSEIFATDDTGVSPVVAFDYDYDPVAEELEILVTGGDMFRAGAVEIRGPRAYGHAGNWWHEYDSEKGPEDGVFAGDTIVLGEGRVGGNAVGSDFEIQLVWHGEETTNLIATTAGPEA